MNAAMHMHRRNVLRGMLGGTAVSVGLPFLDCFLNDHGTALAATGRALPVVFGTWSQGLGFTPGYWEPKTTGANYELGPDVKVLTPLKHKINVFSGLKVFSSQTIPVHSGGFVGLVNGGFPPPGSAPLPSIDALIADVIGTRTRFRSLEVSCDGTPTSFSHRAANATNPSEFSPAALYTRIFGPDFVDPNAADFKPDPKVMVRKSALSAVAEQRTDLMNKLGAADRIRMDEYFTSLRKTEQQLDLMLQKPERLEACHVPKAVPETDRSYVIDDVARNHDLFISLISYALACGQTNVFNVNIAGALSHLRRAGSSDTFHTYTHEEATDENGYQKNVGWFQRQVAELYYKMAAKFDAMREGNQTMLDRMLVLYATDHGHAKLHSSENVPVFTAGGAGGRIKTGIHVAAPGDTLARVGLTIQQAIGVPVNSWGTEGNHTTKPFSEIMA